ncbi:MAG: nucleotide sugar dehydrogenase [Citromicrobium sp.]|nr:MAG: nucleotide sugar dehydrogenase [Citromicrobium sp.]
MTLQTNTATVIGLGYVGLPLAVALAEHAPTVGFDVDRGRIAQLRSGYDRTNEITAEVLASSSLVLTDDAAEVPPSEFYIVTVPTPIDGNNRPDLSIVEAASRSVGALLPSAAAAGCRPVVVFESTVYPGVTEDLCRPILEEASGLACGRDFWLGYSPERINPGDREHTIDRITKVVSGQDAETLARVAQFYERITTGGVFRAASIKAAEAAKVIENTQRDINIAFMNEIAQIFGRMDLSVSDVLAAARTKWNFLPFSPGLVGGHCIGVDPYYLAHRAGELGYRSEVILAGRHVNDSMAAYVAGELHQLLGSQPSDILVLGLTFKENVPDLRNSKVADLVRDLAGRGHRMTVHDPLADAAEAEDEYAITLAPDALDRTYDLVLLAVPHDEYLERGASGLHALVGENGKLADLKGVLAPDHVDWRL